LTAEERAVKAGIAEAEAALAEVHLKLLQENFKTME
jgi:hypothetical protein